MAAPVTSREFSALMADVGPFEKAPKVAVGVSGGADSLALAFLVHSWARGRKGQAVALSVDHGLRPSSADEARQTAKWLKGEKMPHRILVWEGPKPRANIQAAARQERYRLMAQWCRDHGVLHLLVAHHLEDQAETFLLRLSRGSGVDGLCAMAPVTQMQDMRLLRPFLGISRERLIATLNQRGQAWIEDPSNENMDYARVRMRKLLPALAIEGIDPSRLAATARHMSRARAALEDGVADCLAGSAVIYPEGYLWLDQEAFCSASDEIGLRTLARILMIVSGKIYPPRFKNLETLYLALKKKGPGGGHGKGQTLHGCRLLFKSTAWLGKGEKRLLICREAAAADETRLLLPGQRALWDGRFLIERKKNMSRQGRAKDGFAAKVTLRRLSRAGWAQVLSRAPQIKKTAPPYPVVASLPALWEKDRLVAVPHLNYRVNGQGIDQGTDREGPPVKGAEMVHCGLAALAFSPPNALSGKV